MAAPSLKPVEENGTRRPLVSVVMPTYRRPHHIAETVHSILDQTCQDFELLVRDDSPDDETERVVTAILDPRIRYHRNPERLAMPGNLNSGIADARGRYIAVCHDHDLHDRTRLEKMVRLFGEHEDLAFVHTGISTIREDGTSLGVDHVGDFRRYTPGPEWLRFLLSSFSCPVAADAMVPRSIYERHGLYDPDYGFIADVEMWMRLSLAGGVGFVAEPLSKIREREADHEYLGVNWRVIDSLARIHRRYSPKGYSGVSRWWSGLGLDLRLERYIAIHYLICVKRKDKAGRAAGRQYIRQNGRVLSRTLARLR
ncbi:Glycosyltransferase involved in cell wall bisynthesis [Singulisphaera sp. GP187]|uniref:glycosyltransferase family 2 protein n=1 Tax=Singulisphaera sp. GP187 TaxID=1882752 RepID=UPI0009277E31|nr:glycosyltransferase family 2 protein [Singulisphaera sp. GP187]SIO55336.1 Glycosyltransferase involved in cell wall bisynthesis [Singulisphaera sp. GP187]